MQDSSVLTSCLVAGLMEAYRMALIEELNKRAPRKANAARKPNAATAASASILRSSIRRELRSTPGRTMQALAASLRVDKFLVRDQLAALEASGAIYSERSGSGAVYYPTYLGVSRT